MFNEVDETIRRLLIADMPIERNEVDISFERPTREWSNRLSKPTLNLFLLDARELTQYRNEVEQITRTPDGMVRRTRPSRRIDVTYLITAWAREAEDEHRILARVLASMFRQYRVPEEYLQGPLVDAAEPLLLRIAPPDYLVKPADFWGVMDNEMHPNLTWIATMPLNAFAAVEGPLVRTAELRFQEHPDQRWIESTIHVGGVVYSNGDRSEGVEGVTVAVGGTTLQQTTGKDGRFSFPGMPSGERTWRITWPDGKVEDRQVTVPAESYDISSA